MLRHVFPTWLDLIAFVPFAFVVIGAAWGIVETLGRTLLMLGVL